MLFGYLRFAGAPLLTDSIDRHIDLFGKGLFPGLAYFRLRD